MDIKIQEPEDKLYEEFYNDLKKEFKKEPPLYWDDEGIIETLSNNVTLQYKWIYYRIYRTFGRF